MFVITGRWSYYASINHGLLMAQVEQQVQDPLVLSLLWGYLKRVVNDGGWWLELGLTSSSR